MMYLLALPSKAGSFPYPDNPHPRESEPLSEETLKQLDLQIKQVLLEGLGHELYTEAPEIVAREVNNWLQNVHK